MIQNFFFLKIADKLLVYNSAGVSRDNRGDEYHIVSGTVWKI